MNTSDIEKLLAGKEIVVPIWTLRVVVEPMITIDGIMYTAKEYSKFSSKMLDAEKLFFEILYDNQTVGQVKFTNNQQQELTIKLEDTKTKIEHALAFRMSGKCNEHTCLTEDFKDVSWVCKFRFWIESLPMNVVFSKKGSFVIGEAVAQTMTLSTPIYTWLLDNADSIIQDYQLSAAGQDLTV